MIEISIFILLFTFFMMHIDETQAPSNQYETLLGNRYGSKEMSQIFSEQHKFVTWRRIWIALAEAEMELGLPISTEQIDQMKKQMSHINIALAKKFESKFQHDVMAHIWTFGEQCPLAKPIIHLGATSCLITDNADILLISEAFNIIKSKLLTVIRQLILFSNEYKDLPTLSYTHFQPAQPSTVGKRATLWLQDFFMDFEELNHVQSQLKFLGIKGATGTQSSFLYLLNGDHKKVIELERRVALKLGFQKIFPITGQTYPRKQDVFILQLLSSIATSAHKFATDFRLLAHLGEIEEPFGKDQIGSSAMPHKRNPIYTERICALSRHLMTLSQNPGYTAALQWLERSLDDSANRRITLSESFLTCDAVLDLLITVTNRPVVHPNVIRKNLQEQLPYLITENLLLAAAKKGKDRQTVHERLRKHSQTIRQENSENQTIAFLINLIEQDSNIPLSKDEIQELVSEKYLIGRSKEQVEDFLIEIERKLI